jgi:hypothetical protein
LHLFTLQEIEPINWKIEGDKFVLELEHQPQNVKQIIRDNFQAHIESDIEQENPNISIITLTPAFTEIVKNSDEYLPQNLNFIELQIIKDHLEIACDEVFNLEYGQLFFRGLDRVETAELDQLFKESLIGHEHSSSFIKLQRLFNFGLAPTDLSEIQGLERTMFNEISLPEFYNDETLEALGNKFERDGAESKDSIHDNLRIGVRLFSTEDGEEAKYFVRFPRNPSNIALACKTINREVVFFGAETSERFEILNLRPIERQEALILLDRIRLPAPAPQVANGAQLNQGQGQGHN